MNFSSLYMTGAYLNVISGTGPIALMAAVMGNFASAEVHPTIRLSDPEVLDAPVIVTALPELGVAPFPERVVTLLRSPLQEAYAQLKKQGMKKILIALLLPMDRLSAVVPEPFFKKALEIPAECEVIYCHRQGTSAFQTLYEQWEKKGWEAVILAGADSLIETKYCLSIHKKIKVKTQGRSEGLVPGEGAACVVLQRWVPQGREYESSRVTKVIQGPFWEAPKKGSPPEKEVREIYRENFLALQQSNICLIQSAHFSVKSTVEWAQVVRDLCPKIKENFYQLDLQIALGEIGCATLPVSMALASVRFMYPYKPVSHIAVCETHYDAIPGMLLLERYETV